MLDIFSFFWFPGGVRLNTVNCENVRIWCGELHTDCWFNKDICLLRWIMVNSSWLLPVMKWIMVNNSWHSCSVRGTLFWRIANALKLCLGPRTSNLGPRTSGLGPRTSDIEPRTSDLEPRTSDLETRTSNLGPRTSDLEPRTSDLDLGSGSLPSAFW